MLVPSFHILLYKAATTLGNKIYFAGGYNGGYNNYNFSDDVSIYDVVTNVWSSAKMSHAKASVSPIAAGGKIFWGGGFDSIWHTPIDDYIRNVNDIEIFDVATGSHSHHLLNNVTSRPPAIAVKNLVVYFEPSLNQVHIYNFDLDTWTVCDADLNASPELISIGNSVYIIGFASQQYNFVKIWRLDF